MTLGNQHRKSYGESSRNDLFNAYKQSARKRGHSFEITVDQFETLTKQTCFYCGKPPSRVHRGKRTYGEYTYNGIDRIDNKIGYIIENCITCCWECNHMKNSMSQKEFIGHIYKIYNYLEKSPCLQ